MKALPSLSTLWRLFLTQTAWRLRLGRLGRRSILYRPMLVAGAQWIHIGRQTTIRDFARLEVLRQENVLWTPKLKIGNNVNIEQGVHIVCQCEVIIGDNVSITPYCVLIDASHPYDPPDGPKIGARMSRDRSHLRIGDGTWIGAHCIIMPNVTIGKGCVVSAGSVVAHDVPDYCIVAGAPARVISEFDTQSRQWS